MDVFFGLDELDAIARLLNPVSLVRLSQVCS